MYKEAIQLKLRFNSTKGLLTVEDLFDLKLVQLDAMYKHYNKQVKESDEESLLEVKSKEDDLIRLRIDIIKDIVRTKQEANAQAKNAAEVKERKEHLMKLIDAKRIEKDSQKTEEELLEELNNLK